MQPAAHSSNAASTPNTGEAASSARFHVGAATDIGRRRSQNQDSMAVHPELGLFVVADGMGGHQGGETASAMAVEIIPEVVRQAQAHPWNPRTVITNAIRAANEAIHERAMRTPNLKGMGTTTTALLFKDDLLTIGHVGDSRCYFFRLNPENPAEHLLMWQATRDHSLVQEKLRAGIITREEMKTDRMKNVITRSVGFDRELTVDIYEVKIKPGDAFLICSDGLSGQVTDDFILSIVDQALAKSHDPQAAVSQLIENANRNGGDDNITSILVGIKAAEESPK